MTKIPTPVSLFDIVKSAADELRAIKAAEPSEPVMFFEQCQIELTVSATVSPGGKVKFLVFEGGVDAEYSNAQKVTLSFKALDSSIQAVAVLDGEAPLPTGKADGDQG